MLGQNQDVLIDSKNGYSNKPAELHGGLLAAELPGGLVRSELPSPLRGHEMGTV